MSVVWGRIVVGGQDMGAGIVLGARSVLTAGSCVRVVADGDTAADLTVAIPDGPSSSAVVRERIETLDLALLALANPVCGTGHLPLAVRGRASDRWLAPTRPGGQPLVGEVTAARVESAGGPLAAVRLRPDPADHGDQVADQVGDHGWPGMPVFVGPEEYNRVIGILIEQPDRSDPARAADTWHAAAIESAIDQFESLRSVNLLRTLIGGGEAGQQTVAKPRDTTPVEAILRLLDRQGVIDPEVRAIHQVLVGKWATDDRMDGGIDPDEPRDAQS